MNAHPEAAARLERLRGFLQDDPKNAALLEEAADVALQLGLAQDSHALAERALTSKPGNPHLLACLTNAKLALGETQAALQLLEPIAKANEGELALRYNYGYALLRVGRYAEARDVLAAIAENPGAPPNTRPLLVRALHYLGELEAAMEQARKHVDANPDDAAAAGMLSLLYVDTGDWAEARRWSGRALKGAPENLDALLAAGLAAVADEKPGAAQQVLAKALKLRPKNDRALKGMGAAALLKFDIPGAREDLVPRLRSLRVEGLTQASDHQPVIVELN